ncbi:uncharacterized protein FOBCDRAFT_97157, partial [Fusarium oxysporum Fo47]|uniref:uncharacterized protein n=1 Tax=Fusarium oxysporum Fo47 TaxID=660027 RepID=UPI002869CEC5
DILGSKTVSVKTARSSAGDKGRIFNDEGDLYAPGITVIYNQHVYNNEELFQRWIKEDLSTVKSPFTDFLLVMDAASFHLTEGVMEEVKKQLITTALIPAG